MARDIADRLAAFNRTEGGSSRRIGKVMLLTDPPSLDAGEITDKGYINQGEVLTRRVAAVRALYSDDASPIVVTVKWISQRKEIIDID